MSATAVMSELSVEPVTTRRQRREFLQLPWTLYAGDPNWIPPLLFDPNQIPKDRFLVALSRFRFRLAQ